MGPTHFPPEHCKGKFACLLDTAYVFLIHRWMPRCEVKRIRLQQYKECTDEPCGVCTLIKQYIPDVDTVMATDEREQAQRYSNLGPDDRGTYPIHRLSSLSLDLVTKKMQDVTLHLDFFTDFLYVFSSHSRHIFDMQGMRLWV